MDTCHQYLLHVRDKGTGLEGLIRLGIRQEAKGWKPRGGGGRITLTRFCSQRPRNCWNFWDISSWALPTALRTFPKTEKEKVERD